MGGDCLNVGCVPSKALIRSARAAAAVREARKFGTGTVEPEVDFGAVMERLRKLRSDIAPHDSAARFRDLGVDMFLGDAVFESGTTLRVGDTRLEFAKAVIATGARAAAPPIPGLEDIDYMTNETLFSLTERPASLAVVGAGPIGCEMAQTFARLGTNVTLLELTDAVLPREDKDAGEIVGRHLREDGVGLFTGISDLAFTKTEAGIRTSFTLAGEQREETVEQVLVAVGRALNVEGLHTKKGTGKILGATLVAAHAGELLNEITLAMNQGIGLGSLANAIHPYPTRAEAVRRAGDLYNRNRLTPRLKSLFDTWLRWRR